MLKSIVNYVNYNYQFCENIDSPFLSNDEKANECFIKSCLVYKNLHEIYNRNNITLHIYEYDSFHNDVYNRFWNKIH